MSARASELTKQATALLGIEEGSPEHKKLVDIYNEQETLPRGVKMTATMDWCAMFISILAILCKATDIIPIEVSCGKMIELAKKMGIWIEDESITPEEGYFILYDYQDNAQGDNKGWPDHIGYVYAVIDGNIKTIEGNLGNKVAYNTIEVNAVKIRGFIAPKYEPEVVVKTITVGQEIKLKDGATYYDGKAIPSWVKKMKLYARGIDGDKIKFSIFKVGAITGVVNIDDIENLTISYPTSQPTSQGVYFYPAYTGLSNSLDTILKAIGVPSQYYGSWTKRKPLAEKNSIQNYTGTASQNSTLKKLAKEGKLKKV